MASWVIEELRKASRQEANRGSISDDVAGHNDPLLRLALSRVRGNSGIYGSSLSHVLSAPAERLTVASAPASPRLAQRHHDEALLLASQRLAENDLMMISRKIILDFPARLRAVLSIPRYSAVIAWMPHGYAWKIHDIDRFVREILPLFNMDVEIFLQAIEKWGFRQINGGPDRSAYYHEMFLRGLPSLQPLMRVRTELNVLEERARSMRQQQSTESSEPDFYRIRALPQEAHSFGNNQSMDLALVMAYAARQDASVPPSPGSTLESLLRSPSVATNPLGLPSATPPSPTETQMACRSAASDEMLRNAALAQMAAATNGGSVPDTVHRSNVLCLKGAKALADSAAVTDRMEGMMWAAGQREPSSACAAEQFGLSSPSKDPDKSIKKKKNRKKWLPPLGPPIPMSTTTAIKLLRDSSDGRVHPRPTTAAITAATAVTHPDWFFTNPEVFASLSEAPPKT